MEQFTDKDARELFNAANKATAGHMVMPKNIDKEKEKKFARWAKNLSKRIKKITHDYTYVLNSLLNQINFPI